MMLLRRALAAATACALSALLGNAAPAHAQPSDWCPFESSTRVVTANGESLKLWVHQPSSDTLYVCFVVTDFLFTTRLVAGAVVLHIPDGDAIVDAVAVDTDDDECFERLHITDPVEIGLLRLHFTTDPMMVCLGTAVGPAIRVTLSGPVGTPTAAAPEVWIDKSSTVAFFYCTQVTPRPPDCETPWEEGIRLL